MNELQLNNRLGVKLIFLFVLLFTFQTIFSQIIIHGKVIDNNTETPIPYASILIENSAMGTISSKDGNFVLSIQDTLINKNVTISCLGFKKKTEKIKNIIENNIIRLDTVSTFLSEVNIVAFNESRLFNLVQEAINKLRHKVFIESKSKCFINILTSDKNYPVEMITSLGQATINNIDGLTEIILKTGRIAYANSSANKFFNLDFTKTLSEFSAFRKKPAIYLYPYSICNINKSKAKKEFSYKNSEILSYSSEKVLKVNCVKKRRESNYLNTNLLIGLKSGDIYSLTYYGYIKNNFLFEPIDNIHKIDSLYVTITMLFKNHPLDSAYLRHMFFEYKLNYKGTTEVRRIVSKMFINFYDYRKSFYLPKLKFSHLDNDYVKLLNLHFDSDLWHRNYQVVESHIEKEYRKYLTQNGTFINFFTKNDLNFLPKNSRSFINWSAKKRLTWDNINTNSLANPLVFSKSISYKNRQFDEDLYKIDFQIYFDVYQLNDSIKVFTQTLFSKNTSFYYLNRNADALSFINLYFDIYEASRKIIENKINTCSKISIPTADSIYNAEMQNLGIKIKQFKKEVKRGSAKEKMKKWRDAIHQELSTIK